MYRFQNILVNVPLRGADASLIRYASKITRLAKSARVHFFHADIPPDMPDAVRQKYPWLMEPITEASKKRLAELVDQLYDGHPDTQVTQEVIEGAPLYEILRRSQDMDADLIIINRDAYEESMAVKLARKCACSLMILSGDDDVDFKEILVPVDFSQYASDAVDVALAFALSQGLDHINLHHAFHLPYGHHKSTLPKEDMEADLRAYAEEQMEKFVGSTDMRGLQARMMIDCEPFVPRAVFRKVEETGADLVMVGSRGRNALASLLLGSNAEGILEHIKVPLVIVKKKGAGQTLLRALLQGRE